MTETIHTPKGEITIRPATAEDADAVYALRLEALRVNPESFAADLDKTAADGPQEWERLVTNYAAEGTGTLMVASAGQSLVGMTGLFCRNRPKTRHFGTAWGVYVSSDWRGHRIGEGLINGCVDWALTHEMLMVNLGVNTLNTPAIRCYTRCGFTIYATEPKVIFYDGVYFDEYLMIKYLRPGLQP